MEIKKYVPPKPPTITDLKVREYKKDLPLFMEEQYIIIGDSGLPELIKLDQWQKDILRTIFHTYDEDGKRLITKAIIGIPRKNGKSALCSGIAIWATLFDVPREARVYSAAGSREQAGIIFTEANKAINRNVNFRGIFKCPKEHRIQIPILVPSLGSEYKVVSSDGELAHGLNPTMVIFDELHVQTDYILWEAFRTAFGARMKFGPQHPLILAITTAGLNLYMRDGKIPTPCYEEYRKGIEKIIKADMLRHYFDNQLNQYIISDDYKRHLSTDTLRILENVQKGKDEDIVWLKNEVKSERKNYFLWSHENLLSAISQDWLLEQKRELKNRLRIYQILHENKWTGGAGTLLTADQVDKIFFDNLSKQIEGDIHKTYYIGVDVGARKDRTVVAIIHKEDKGMIVVDNLRTWITPAGSTVKISEIEEHVYEMAEAFHITMFSGKLIYDPTHFLRSIEEIEKTLPVVEFKSSIKHVQILSKQIVYLTVDEKLQCYKHDMLRSELLGLQEVYKGSWFRIDHESGGFWDHIVAIAMAATTALEETEEDIFREFDNSQVLPIFIPAPI